MKLRRSFFNYSLVNHGHGVHGNTGIRSWQLAGFPKTVVLELGKSKLRAIAVSWLLTASFWCFHHLGYPYIFPQQSHFLLSALIFACRSRSRFLKSSLWTWFTCVRNLVLAGNSLPQCSQMYGLTCLWTWFTCFSITELIPVVKPHTTHFAPERSGNISTSSLVSVVSLR